MADSSVSSPSGLLNPNTIGVVQSPFTPVGATVAQYTLSDTNPSNASLGVLGGLPAFQVFKGAGNKFVWATIPRASANGKTFKSAFVSSIFLGTGGFFGIGVRESGTGKAVAIGLRNDAGTLQYEKLHILNDTTLDVVVESFVGQFSEPLWLQMREFNGNWAMVISANGQTLATFTAEGLTAYCTPDQIGYAANSGGTTNIVRQDIYSQTYQ